MSKNFESFKAYSIDDNTKTDIYESYLNTYDTTLIIKELPQQILTLYCNPIKPNVKKMYIAQLKDSYYIIINNYKNIRRNYFCNDTRSIDNVLILRSNNGYVPFSTKVFTTKYENKIINFKYICIKVFDYTDKPLLKSYPCNFNNVYLKILDYSSKFCQLLRSHYTTVKDKNDKEPLQAKRFTVNSLTASKENEKKFLPKTATVIQRTKVIINNGSAENISLVIQKMEFFEIKLNGAISVSGLPEGVTFATDSIKGSIANSGEYFIDITYNDGNKQTIDLFIPFYRRLQ